MNERDTESDPSWERNKGSPHLAVATVPKGKWILKASK